MRGMHPDVTIWTAAIDETLDDKLSSSPALVTPATGRTGRDKFGDAVMRRIAIVIGLCFFALTAAAARAEPQWITLPATPTLPDGGKTGLAPINGIKLWYGEFGHGTPVILVHGGLANANYWGLLVRALAPHYRVIVMDSAAMAARRATRIPTATI